MKYSNNLVCIVFTFALVSVTFGYTTNVSANGGEFMGDSAQAEHGSSFFGFVKDLDGKPLPNFVVILTCKTGCTETHVQTDALGHYFFRGFAKEIDPKSVEVTCRGTRYHLVSTTKRPPAGKDTTNTAIEIDCVMRQEMSGKN